ncbi:hypothetical protein WH87_04595 [Devosia epidermidihirudinis]|uniref:Uncharacterized protein n=1 Tax=Devosia epidermidihirudinis TaxID=1293439 RepID=A0A0F5QFI8_9HYPH|nr:hypothetical protein WH87_04595 [Devosia epidermidihirudinis]
MHNFTQNLQNHLIYEVEVTHELATYTASFYIEDSTVRAQVLGLIEKFSVNEEDTTERVRALLLTRLNERSARQSALKMGDTIYLDP